MDTYDQMSDGGMIHYLAEILFGMGIHTNIPMPWTTLFSYYIEVWVFACDKCDCLYF